MQRFCKRLLQDVLMCGSITKPERRSYKPRHIKVPVDFAGKHTHIVDVHPPQVKAVVAGVH